MPKRRQPRSCFYLGMNRSRCQRPPAISGWRFTGKLFSGLGFAATPAAGRCSGFARAAIAVSVTAARSAARQSRLRQHQAANRRHQRSPEGRLDHRDRQRAYRCRQFLRRVTDQGSQILESHPPSEGGKAVTMPAVVPLRVRRLDRRSIGLCCMVCGRTGRLVDPFPRTSSRR